MDLSGPSIDVKLKERKKERKPPLKITSYFCNELTSFFGQISPIHFFNKKNGKVGGSF